MSHYNCWPRPHVCSMLLLLAFVAILQILPCSNDLEPSCSNEEACNGKEKSWIGRESDLLHLISNRTQRNVAQSSEDLFISLETTLKYHDTRLPPILFTWLQTINPSQANIEWLWFIMCPQHQYYLIGPPSYRS